MFFVLRTVEAQASASQGFVGERWCAGVVFLDASFELLNGGRYGHCWQWFGFDLFVRWWWLGREVGRCDG